MKDIQNEPDYRNIPIDKVGIKNLRYPITVLDRKKGPSTPWPPSTCTSICPTRTRGPT